MADAQRKGPLADRTQEIVSEARRRVADGGGRASDLPAMIQKVTNEYRTSDTVRRERGGPNAEDNFQMPNNMEAYLDEVLRMSGMTGTPQQAGAPISGSGGSDSFSGGSGVSADNLGDSINDPTLPETTDVVPQARPDDLIKQADAEGWSLGQIASTLLGIGGSAAAARMLYNMYNQNNGDASKVVSNAVSEMDDMLSQADMEPTRGRANVPAVAETRLPEINVVDDAIDQTLGDEAINNRIEGANNSQARLAAPQGKIADAGLRDKTINEAASMPVRQAVQHLRQNGVEITEDILRMLAENSNTVRNARQNTKKPVAKKSGRDNLKSRVNNTTRSAVRQAAKP